jgi:hypothetical protein
MSRIISDADVPAVTRACLGAINGPDGPTDEQLLVLSAVVSHQWQRPDIDLASVGVLAPDEAAALITDVPSRRRTSELMVLLELCRHPLKEAHEQRIEEYCNALGIDDAGVELARDLVTRGTTAAWDDWTRRFTALAPEMMEPAMIELAGADERTAAKRFADIDAKLRAAAPGTLGAKFVDFYDRNGFVVGPGSISLFGHDMSHVIGGYDATPAGEICIGAMKLMITDSDIHWLEFLGNVAIHEAGFTPDGYEEHQPAFSRPEAIEMMGRAMERGRDTTRDFSNVDHLPMIDWRYEDVLAEFGVPPL